MQEEVVNHLKPQNDFDGYMKMLVFGIVTSMLFCFVVILLGMLFVDGLLHWLFILVMPFAFVVSVLAMTIVIAVARLFRFQKKFFNRIIVGIIYGVISNVFVFIAYKKFELHLLMAYVVPIFIICTIIGFISARFLPDKQN